MRKAGRDNERIMKSVKRAFSGRMVGAMAKFGSREVESFAVWQRAMSGGGSKSSEVDGSDSGGFESVGAASSSGGGETGGSGMSAAVTPHPCRGGPVSSSGVDEDGPSKNPTWEGLGRLDNTFHPWDR